MLSECCLWRQHSNNFGCELQTYPRSFTKVISCKCCVVWVLFECCLWRQHSDNFGPELQTYPRLKKKKSCKCCLNVVSGDNIQTTLAARCKHVQDFQTKCKCCLKHWDNIETTLRQHSGKRSVFRLFLAQNKCFRPLKKVKNTYFATFINLLRVANMSSFFVNKMCFVPVLSECCLQGRHLDNIHNICLRYFFAETCV